MAKTSNVKLGFCFFHRFSTLVQQNYIRTTRNMLVHITEDDYNEDTDECDKDNTTSSCSASVDDEDIKTPYIPLKIQSIFQILYYNIPRGKMKLLFTL